MRINSMKVLGQAIRARRKELGYSQQEMAEYCGCGTRFVSDLENGKRPSVWQGPRRRFHARARSEHRRERGSAVSDLLRVYKGGVLVGVLDKGDGEPFYGFTYDEAY